MSHRTVVLSVLVGLALAGCSSGGDDASDVGVAEGAQRSSRLVVCRAARPRLTLHTTSWETTVLSVETTERVEESSPMTIARSATVEIEFLTPDLAVAKEELRSNPMIWSEIGFLPGASVEERGRVGRLVVEDLACEEGTPAASASALPAAFLCVAPGGSDGVLRAWDDGSAIRFDYTEPRVPQEYVAIPFLLRRSRQVSLTNATLHHARARLAAPSEGRAESLAVGLVGDRERYERLDASCR